MCTHLLVEAEGLADQIVVLEDGTDLISGTPGRAHPPLLARQPRAPRRRGPAISSPQLAGIEGVVRGRRGCDDTREVQLDDLARVPDLVAKLVADGVRLTRVEPHEPTLEDLYFAVRQRAPRHRPSPAAVLPRGAPHRRAEPLDR